MYRCRAKMNLEIKKADVSDIQSLTSLINSIVLPYKSEQYLNWHNFSSQIPTINYCAHYKDEIVGMFMVFRRKLTNGLVCGVLMGLAVKKEFRGDGLFKKLGDYAMDFFEDIDVFCCLPGSYGKNAIVKNFGFKALGSIKTMFFDNKMEHCDQKYTCKQISHGMKFDNFTKENQKYVMFLADNEFRQWRFASHPRYLYNLIQFDSGEFVITKQYFHKEKGINFCDIVDFECQKMEEKRLHDLLNCACSCLKKDADIVTIQAIPDSFLYKAVKQMGFVESNMEHFFCLKVAKQRYEHLYNASDWLIKWGDYLR